MENHDYLSKNDYLPIDGVQEKH